MLKTLGKYIRNSGLDQAFTEPEINGPSTVEQIKNGKNMRRYFEGNTTLYVKLFCVCIWRILSAFTHSLRKNCQKDFPTLQSWWKNFTRKEKYVIRQIHHDLDCPETNFLKKSRNLTNPWQINLSTYSILWKGLKHLLLFVRSTGQCLWEEHLTSLNEFITYFLALGFHAEYSPVYLSNVWPTTQKFWNLELLFRWEFVSEQKFGVILFNWSQPSFRSRK